jgi:aminoglycoside 6-adenylyltransferase
LPIDGSDGDVIATMMRWGESRTSVRAMLLTSTRAISTATIDPLSDYDIILVVDDIRPYVADRSWLSDFGDILIVYWDPVQPDPVYGIEQCGNVTQYVDGLKLDFTLWPVPLFRRIAAAPELPVELDAGHKVLLDKDNLAASMLPATGRAYIPAPPTRREYETWVNDFLSDAPYVAKCLWRDDLMPAKWCLDYDMKHVYLLKMLAWYIGVETNWSVPVGNLGKGMKKLLPAHFWNMLEQAFAGSGLEDNWRALDVTMELFRQVAVIVGAALGYGYPQELHQRVAEYVARIKRLPRS